MYCLCNSTPSHHSIKIATPFHSLMFSVDRSVSIYGFRQRYSGTMAVCRVVRFCRPPWFPHILHFSKRLHWLECFSSFLSSASTPGAHVLNTSSAGVWRALCQQLGHSGPLQTSIFFSFSISQAVPSISSWSCKTGSTRPTFWALSSLWQICRSVFRGWCFLAPSIDFCLVQWQCLGFYSLWLFTKQRLNILFLFAHNISFAFSLLLRLLWMLH